MRIVPGFLLAELRIFLFSAYQFPPIPTIAGAKKKFFVRISK
jgi:hypothetical protein